MKLYKLTDENDRTHCGCQWGEGVQHLTSGEGGLCGPGWTHWYTDPLLAVFLNPVHGNFDLKTAHLWEGDGTPEKEDHGLKVGCRDGKTLKRVPLPKVTKAQCIRFGILCAMEVCDNATEAVGGAWTAEAAAAARAAEAARAGKPLDLIALARRAVDEEK